MIDLPDELDVFGGKLPKSAEKPPTERFPDPDEVAQMVDKFILDDSERAQVDAYVKAMLDGNPPFDHGKLVLAGRASDTNVNFREGEAMLGDALTPFYDLFAESRTYFEIEVDEEDPQKRAAWSRTVTNEFDALLKEWDEFDWNIQQILHDMVAFGKGFAFWPNRTTWRFRGIRQSRVKVPNQSPSSLDQMHTIVLLQDFPVHELYAPIRKTGGRKGSGWNKEAVLDAIHRVSPKSATDLSPVDYELLQQQLRNHDLHISTQSSMIKGAHVLIKEYNDKITHLIIERNGSNGKADPTRHPNADATKSRFLFRKVGRYDSFRQALCPFFYDIGDGTYHSIKGLAIKLQAFLDIKNRLNCAVVDNARLTMSVLLKPTTANAHEDASLTFIGPMTVLPPNMEVQQWGLAGRLEEGLAVEQALTRKLESNLGQYRKAEQPKSGNPDTATKVTYDAAKEASLGKGAVNRFYVQLDGLGDQTYPRAANPNLVDDNGGPNTKALEFQKRCLKAGVPKVKLMKPRFVRATRNIGNGSIFLRQQTILQTMQLVSQFNEAGRQNWLDSAIGVLAGTENIALWNPRQQLPDRLVDEAAWATLENAALAEGAPVMWTPTQNNVVHFSVHLKAAVDGLNSVAQGGDPMKVLAFVNATGQHMAIHLQEMARDPTQVRAFKQAEAQFKELQAASGQLMQKIAQMQADKDRIDQRKRQISEDAQLDLMELEHKKRLSSAKTAFGMDEKAKKGEQARQLADASTASRIRLDTASTLAAIELQKQKAETNGAEK